jgi:hypothetical protein
MRPDWSRLESGHAAEAKWGQVMAPQHVERLNRARDLLSANFDTTGTVLTCYSAAGFHDDLQTSKQPRQALISLADLYRG